MCTDIFEKKRVEGRRTLMQYVHIIISITNMYPSKRKKKHQKQVLLFDKCFFLCMMLHFVLTRLHISEDTIYPMSYNVTNENKKVYCRTRHDKAK